MYSRWPDNYDKINCTSINRSKKKKKYTIQVQRKEHPKPQAINCLRVVFGINFL